MAALVKGAKDVPVDELYWYFEPVMGVFQVWKRDPERWRENHAHCLGGISLARLEGDAAMLCCEPKYLLMLWLRNACSELGLPRPSEGG